MHERDIFLTALEFSQPEERESYLADVCGEDAQLRSRVEALLDSSSEAESFLENPAVAAERPTELINGETDFDGSQPAYDEQLLSLLDPAPQTDLLGRLGPYEIQAVLGSGGMGIVLKAHDPKLNRTVAIKVLALQFAAHATARQRFLREAQAAAAVTHPNVVTIHAVDENDRHPYLVMECVEGFSLREKIDREGALELKVVLRIGSQIAAGLAAAHAHGLIHRDIKPANILLENGVERVKITDFGLARAADDLSITRTGEVAGTPQYMSPEQASGKVVDQRSDLFSLGSVLYAMCTGRAAFRADGTMAVLHRVCNDTPRPIREVNPDIPPWLATIIDRLLAKNAADRIQSAEEVADLLAKCLAYVQHPTLITEPPEATSTKLEQIVGADLAVSIEQGTEETSADTSATSELKQRPRREERTRRPRLAGRWLVATAALLLIGLLAVAEGTGVTHFAGTVIRLVTGEGTLVIEVDDPGVQVSLDGDHVTIRGGGVEELRLTPGQYKFTATKDGKPIKTQLISITRGGKETVRVSLEGQSVEGAAGQSESLQKDAIDTQWVSLFNGKDLTGWKTLSDFPGDWSVKDGILIGRGKRGDSVLYSERDDFENFHLRVEMRLGKGSKSGIFFRSSCDDSADAEDPVPARFAQLDITNLSSQKRWCTYLRRTTDERTAYRIPRVERAQGSPPEGWFTVEIIANGSHLLLKCNGDVLMDYADMYYPYTRGHLALQVHKPESDAVVEFRKIEIRELYSNLDATTDAIELSSSDILFSDDWEWTKPVNLGPKVNSEHGDWTPSLSRDGLTLVFTSNRPGGSGGNDLWMSRRPSVDAEWARAVNLGPVVNSEHSDSSPCLASDGLTLLFSSDRGKGVGGEDLWMCTRKTRDSAWSRAVNLGPTINHRAADADPFLSLDGLILFFRSRRPGGEGGDDGNDLWLSHRASLSDEWSQPVNLGPQINSEHWESSPCLSADGRALLFTSDRLGPDNIHDLWISRGVSPFGPWSEPVKVGAPVNGEESGGYGTLSADCQTFIFESGRTILGAHDLWMTRRVPRIDHLSQAIELADHGKPDEAAQEFSLALALAKQSLEPGRTRVAILRQISPDEVFQRLTDLRPDDIDLWRDRGYILAEKGRYEEAAACLQKRLELGPAGAGCWVACALALLANNDIDGYRDVCAQILKAFSRVSNPQELCRAAKVMTALPEAVEAQQSAFALAERAYRTAPDDKMCQRSYAMWLYRTDRLEDALELIDQFGATSPEADFLSPRIACIAAMAHYRLGRPDEAQRWADRAKELAAAAEQYDWASAAFTQRLTDEMSQVLAANQSEGSDSDGEPEQPPPPPTAQPAAESEQTQEGNN